MRPIMQTLSNAFMLYNKIPQINKQYLYPISKNMYIYLDRCIALDYQFNSIQLEFISINNKGIKYFTKYTFT